MTRWGQVQNTETTNTIHRTNRSNSALSIAPMFNLTTNLLCHKTSQQAATVQQLPSTELCLRIVWLSDGPAPRRWSPVKVSMELWARHMGRHCMVDKIVTFWGREFPFFSAFSVQSTDLGWIAGPGREWQQYYSTGHPWWMVTERNASRKWKCCKTVSKGDDAVKSEVEQGYALDQAMISIFSIFRSKAGVKLTFYWWLILLRCCLSVAATLQTTVMLPVCC